MTKSKNTSVKAKSIPLNDNWLLSRSKHIYVIREADQHGTTHTIGYARTRKEADLLIYDSGKKLFAERKEYRAQKGKYTVTYSYNVDDAQTRFILHERSIGYLYNGHKINRFTLTFEKVNRAYNRLYTLCELEDLVMETELHHSCMDQEGSGTTQNGAEEFDNDSDEAAEVEEACPEDSQDDQDDQDEQNDESEISQEAEANFKLTPWF